MVVNFREYINREIFCCFFAEQASLTNTRVYNYKNEINMALRCFSTSGVSSTKKMHILRTEFALMRRAYYQEKEKQLQDTAKKYNYSWRDVKTGLDIIEKYSFFWEIGGRRTLPSLPKKRPSTVSSDIISSWLECTKVYHIKDSWIPLAVQCRVCLEKLSIAFEKWSVLKQESLCTPFLLL